jgi:hypothetical protein
VLHSIERCAIGGGGGAGTEQENMGEDNLPVISTPPEVPEEEGTEQEGTEQQRTGLEGPAVEDNEHENTEHDSPELEDNHDELRHRPGIKYSAFTRGPYDLASHSEQPSEFDQGFNEPYNTRIIVFRARIRELTTREISLREELETMRRESSALDRPQRAT